MKLAEATRYALGNLRRHKLRTVLTSAGVAVGIGTLTLMVSLGTGLEKLFTDQFNQTELVNQILVMRKGTDPLAQLAGPQTQTDEGAPLTDDVIAQFAGLPGVRAAYPQLTTFLVIEAGQRISPCVIEGLPAAALSESFDKALIAGRYWDQDGLEPVCVLPSSLVEELGFAQAADVVGVRVAVTRYTNAMRYERQREEVEGPDGVLVETARFVRPDGIEVSELTVVGVYEAGNFGPGSNSLQLPQATARSLIERFDVLGRASSEPYENAVVKVEDYQRLEEIEERIGQLGFDTRTIFDILQFMRIGFYLLEAVLAFFGSIGLVVAFFGITNTMLMAVLERTREIGVLKAIGARDRDVRRVFLVEAATIGLGGAAVGLGCGWSIGQLLNALAGVFWEPLQGTAFFHVPTWLALTSLGLGTVVAVIAGIYPAWRASRMAPVEALRRE